MNTRKAVSLVSLMLLVGLLVPNLSVGAASPTANGPTQVVQVPAKALPAVEALGLEPHLALDYGSFFWLELDAADASQLAASAIPFAPLPEAGQIRFQSFRFGREHERAGFVAGLLVLDPVAPAVGLDIGDFHVHQRHA